MPKEIFTSGQDADARAREGLLGAHAYHGLPFVEEALHLNDPEYDFKNKKIALFGLPKGRSRAGDMLVKRGARVTEVGMEKIATNARKPFVGALPELKEAAVYDQLAVYLGIGLYFKKPFPPLFRGQPQAIDDYIKSVNYESGGECHFIASDFTETDKEAKKDGVVRGALAPVQKFLKVSGMDRYQGKTLLGAVQERIKDNPDLEAVERTFVRPAGTGYWPEIRDLYVMLERECDDALEELRSAPLPIRVIAVAQFLNVKKRLAADIFKVDTILSRPETERPTVTPPVFKVVTVRKRTPLRTTSAATRGAVAPR